MSKWLDFVEQTTRGKTRKVAVMNKSGEYLGLIKWNSHWRQYCFFVEWDHYEPFKLILAKSCLDDISGYIEGMMFEWRADLKQRAKPSVGCEKCGSTAADLHPRAGHGWVCGQCLLAIQTALDK